MRTEDNPQLLVHTHQSRDTGVWCAYLRDYVEDLDLHTYADTESEARALIMSRYDTILAGRSHNGHQADKGTD